MGQLLKNLGLQDWRVFGKLIFSSTVRAVSEGCITQPGRSRAQRVNSAVISAVACISNSCAGLVLDSGVGMRDRLRISGRIARLSA